MKRVIFICLGILLIFNACSTVEQKQNMVAETPPMGWNSWDCFGVDLHETELIANMNYMAEHLQEFGWEYLVNDILWYGGEDINIINFKKENPSQRIDEYGRLVPDISRFPSCVDGDFSHITNLVHEKGLKFGIHVMRGIPWQAVEQNTPILDTEYHARDIAVATDTCIWYDGMLGVNLDHPAGQAYYNSIINLYAEWGIDYIKVDDISFPYHDKDIAAIRKAIDKCGRDIVLSLSPGAAPREQAEHLTANANLWRISPDFWDDWKFLYRQFELCKTWQGVATPGHWPDADMLPMGKLRKRGSDDYVLENTGLTLQQVTDEYSRFTDEEKKTMMSLWCIFRSPLMLGGNLPETDDYTFSLITNAEALAVNQVSLNNRQLYRNDAEIAWVADVPDSKDKYLALFNVGDDNKIEIIFQFADLGIEGNFTVRDLWKKQDIGTFNESFSVTMPPHGSGLYRISVTE